MASINNSSRVARSIAGPVFALLLAGPALAQVTSIVSRNSPFPNDDAIHPVLSADGRYASFFWYQGFVRSDVVLSDRLTGTIELVSVNSNEVRGDNYSYTGSFTPDLRYVAFHSWSTNLVPGDTNGPYPVGRDVFVRDRLNGTTTRVNVSSSGAQGNGESYHASISADGRYVAFTSHATNFAVGDSNGVEDVFVRDVVNGITERVNLDSAGAQADGACLAPSISADGRYVVFQGAATNLVVGDTNGSWDVFVRDRLNGTTERVSVDSSGAQADGNSDSAVITPDGRYVAFRSVGTNLVAGDTNGKTDAFLHDRQTGAVERISIGSSGAEGDGDSISGALTPDARYVVFASVASNLVPGDTNGRWDAFVRDRQLATTQRVSLGANGVQGDESSGLQGLSISANGQFVAFGSRARLVAADANNYYDVYVRDRRYAPLTSVCSPGLDGVIACPCSNPPSGPGRGCDNAAGTGGAILSASGIAQLSVDSLVLTTSGEGPTALSIVLQGDALLASGAVFGQGVRCVDGALRRLYAKAASGGSIIAPDFSAGDPTISTRSAVLGDTIQPGQSRWYVVYYRDPIALGGCPASSTFNATQTGSVLWLP
jgi:Tol biopolymer transport system component